MLRLPHKCDLLYRHYRPIIVVAVLAALVGGYFSSKLTLQSDLDELLPESFTSVQALNRMKEEVGGVGRLRVVFETANFAAVERLVRDLEPRLLESPLIKYVDYENDVAFYRKNALLFLDTFALDSLHDAIQGAIDAQKQRLNPLMVDDLFGDDTADDELAKWETQYQDQEPKPYYTNSDSTVLVVQIFPYEGNSSISAIRAMLDDVRQIIGSVDWEQYDTDIKVYYGGNFKNRLDEYEVVLKDILGTALYGVTGVFLLIVLYFRRLLGAILVSVSLLFSLAWTFGVTYLVIGELNTITGFLFVILFGLGIDYGIHAFARYVKSRQAGLDSKEAIHKMVCQTGAAIGTTAVTTAAAFFSLMLMDFKGFAHLGFIAGVGVLFAFVGMVVVLPTLIILAETVGLLRIEPLAHAKTSTREKHRFRYARQILLIVLPLAALGAYWLAQVEFEYDFTNLRAITEERRLVSEKAAGVFTRSESPAVIMGESREDVEEIVAAVRLQMRQDTTVRSVRSIFSLVPDGQDQRLERIRAIRTLVEGQAAQVLTGDDKRRLEKLRTYLQVDEPFTWEEFPQDDKRQFIDKKGEIGNFVFVYTGVPLRDGRNAIAFRDAIGTITTASGKVFHAASSNIISAELLVLMVREGKLTVVLAFTVVFLLVFADFRSLKATLLVLTPLAIGFFLIGGVMHVVGMKLNFFNVVVLPTIIGIGVDNGVHIYHRYLEEGPGSLRLVLRRTGLAIAMTTSTTIVGYSGLILARHPGLNSIGLLAVIGISATFVAAVVVLPALLQVLEEKRVAPEA